MTGVIVIGAGVGGLTTAALLAKAGLQVTVLEAHIYPGGSAGTFYYQGYQFDAGATLAGGFNHDGPMEHIRQRLELPSWLARPTGLAMQVHLPSNLVLDRWSDERRWAVREQAFGDNSLAFWRWQERTADAMWSLAAQSPVWPLSNFSDLSQLVGSGWRWLKDQGGRALQPGLLLDAIRPVSAHLRGQSDDFRLFVDGQLLISAQALAGQTVALYGAAALDLPRRGVVHFEGGMIGIARHLAEAVTANGGEILYRHRVESIQRLGGDGYRISTRRGGEFTTDLVVANLTPHNLAQLFGQTAPDRLKGGLDLPADGWGAFTGYLGVEGRVFDSVSGLHHQIIRGRPLAEGNSVFLSVSPAWDPSRAPAGQRAITLSTHTRLEPWWHLFEHDRPAYEARKARYLEHIVALAERAVPGLKGATKLALPGTPVTFQRFTSRRRGWVGGFPQTSLTRAWPARLDDGLFMVGDSIFPGQSTAAVALGGIRVGDQILASLSTEKSRRSPVGGLDLAPAEKG